MATPVALFVYNRPRHTKATIEALGKNLLAAETNLFIFSDGAKRDSDKILVEEVRQICRFATGFRTVTLIERSQNRGLAANIIDGITSVLKDYERVICLEDDLLTTIGFLEYMNNALEFYNGKNVFSISGYTPKIRIPADYPYSTYNVMRNSSWGWATWRSKWEKIDWSVGDYKQFIKSKTLSKSFEQAGNDTVVMLLKQQQGLINSWSIRFNYAAFKADEPTVYPVKSLITNTGVDGSGTNMRKSRKYISSTVEKIDSTVFAPENKIDKTVAKRFRDFYNTSLIRRTINILKLTRFRLMS